ncbi:epoxide hydrolase family protein [Desertihabitans aurantiacus]|uniref:epoxide hydrolase family protein n=1 Tax=Desertihabitans aurantiacus TaxID=2282477 RepID=UPI000DF75EA1|nr:epoxide hydrolase family protein [Desertihabitans aurantiacus]
MDENTRTFRIHVSDADLDDLRSRLARTRWPDVVDPDDTSGGVPLTLVRRLVEHWRDGYDWRAHETALNELDHRLARVGGLDLHHVVVPAEPPSGVPVVLLHGWPDSFYRYSRLAPLLAAAGHPVVIPSMPGFPFSEQPTAPMTVALVADLVHELLGSLGHERYAVHGGDWGSSVAEQLATAHPEAVRALHLTDVPVADLFTLDPAEVGEVEREFLERTNAWAEEASYYRVQGNDPNTLAFGLADSPVGLAAWLVDKYQAWTDREVDLDQTLTQISLYWHTNTIRSSMRLYAESFAEWSGTEDAGDDAAGTGDDGTWGGAGPLAVPTAFALFPADIGRPPRELAERFFDVRRFTLLPRGGHFGALEEPELLAEDLLGFLRELDA